MNTLTSKTAASTAKAGLVVGAGDSPGSALARRFAREGFAVCVARRNADQLKPLVDSIHADGGTAHAFGCDARKEDQIASLFESIERDIGTLESLAFNFSADVNSVTKPIR